VSDIKSGVELLDQSGARDQLRAPGWREQLGGQDRSRHSRIIEASAHVSAGGKAWSTCHRCSSRFPQLFFPENLKLSEGGDEGRDNDIVRETFERTGASATGKR
jgi:hypothetical protein